jgi:hypothetical protein
MLRVPVILLALTGFLAHGNEPLVVKIGTTDIKIPIPAGMVDMPKDPETTKALADLTPPDELLLRACIDADAVDPTEPQDPSADTMHAFVYALKDVQQDIYSGDFIEFVGKVADTAVHSVLESENSYFDFEESQKRLDQFEKDTGITMQADGALYSLGMVSRSGGCVSFMTAQYVTVTTGGKPQREKCITVEGYLLLSNKIVVVLTTLTGPAILHGDLLTLKHAAEKYQIALQQVNN